MIGGAQKLDAWLIIVYNQTGSFNFNGQLEGEIVIL